MSNCATYNEFYEIQKEKFNFFFLVCKWNICILKRYGRILDLSEVKKLVIVKRLSYANSVFFLNVFIGV